jgi:hypothetical protein
VIDGEVIGGELPDGVAGQFDFEAEFTVRCDNGACFRIQEWMIEVEILDEAPQRVMWEIGCLAQRSMNCPCHISS